MQHHSRLSKAIAMLRVIAVSKFLLPILDNHPQFHQLGERSTPGFWTEDSEEEARRNEAEPAAAATAAAALGTWRTI